MRKKERIPSLLLVVRNFVLFDLLGLWSWLVPEDAFGVLACWSHFCAEHICEVGFQLRLPSEQTWLDLRIKNNFSPELSATVGAGHWQLSRVPLLVHNPVLGFLEILATKTTEKPCKFIVVVHILDFHVTLFMELSHVAVVEYHATVLAVNPVWIFKLHR